MAFVRAIVRAFERYGVDPAGALRTGQIAASEVERPDARITARQLELLSGAAMQELDDEALGWFSRRLPWGSYGMLCRASITAPTLGVALRRWCRHHGLLTEDVRLELSGLPPAAEAPEAPAARRGVPGRPPPATHAEPLAASGEAAALSIEERRLFGELREFCLVTLLRYVHGYACWAVDSRIPLLEAAFPFAPPPHADVYPLLFPGPIRFGAERAALRFDAQYLALPLRRDERALQQMLKRALPLTVFQYRRDRLLVQRVRQLLHGEAERVRSAEDVARSLGVSVRTLHRQIREEGGSLQGLKDEARRDLAVELLQRSDRSVKQVAWAVGFRSEKSFARAFGRWTGEPPAAYRRGARGG